MTSFETNDKYHNLFLSTHFATFTISLTEDLPVWTKEVAKDVFTKAILVNFGTVQYEKISMVETGWNRFKTAVFFITDKTITDVGFFN